MVLTGQALTLQAIKRQVRDAVFLTQEQFRELPEYSLSYPTGSTPGKSWKKKVQPRGESPTWFYCTWVPVEDKPGHCVVDFKYLNLLEW